MQGEGGYDAECEGGGWRTVAARLGGEGGAQGGAQLRRHYERWAGLLLTDFLLSPLEKHAKIIPLLKPNKPPAESKSYHPTNYFGATQGAPNNR